MIHSTGSKKRLSRKFGTSMRDKKYAFEELVAEIGASFLCAEAGFLHYTMRNSLAYLKGWRKRLVKLLKEDNRAIFKAAALAQKACDYILDRDKNGTPKYLQTAPADPQTGQLKLPGLNKPATSFKPIIIETSGQEPIVVFKSKPAVKEYAPGIPAVPNHTRNDAKNEEPEIKREPFKSESIKKGSLAELLANKKPGEKFHLKPEYEAIKTFLGAIEKKEVESVAITLSGEQGSGKTRFLFQVMNAFADSKYRCLHLSLEEHPGSALYEDKAYEYLTPLAMSEYIETKELSKTNYQQELDEWIADADIIFIDSAKKLAKLKKGFDMDEDLRKKYDGKLFFIIYQLNQDGSMKGGSDAQFDGDIILFCKKDADYTKSYIYPNKNRYQNIPLDQLKFNIYEGKLMAATPEPVAQKKEPVPNTSIVI